MYKDNYRSKPLFPYAVDYCMVLPKGLEDKFGVGRGTLIIEKDYLIYFKPDTPEDIKTRFIKDYAEYHTECLRKRKELGIYVD